MDVAGKRKGEEFWPQMAAHVIFWVCVYSLMTVNHLDGQVSSFEVMGKALIVVSLIIAAVYVHFYVFDAFFSRKIIYSVLLLGLIAAFVLVKNLVFMVFLGADLKIVGSIYTIITYLGITTLIKLAKTGFEQRVILQEIRAKHLQTELAFLKSQINPHFLFNTLNNLFGQVRKLDETAAAGIAQLSHLVRYMVYESNVDQIELDKEIEQMNRLIELQKLRFSQDDDVLVDFVIEGNTSDVRIPPMLLFPFIENAFKHGISLDETSFIKIRLTRQGNSLDFLVSNSVHRIGEDVAEAEGGMGLRNVKRRLDLLFPERHQLQVNDSNQQFEVHLSLTLGPQSSDGKIRQ